MTPSTKRRLIIGAVVCVALVACARFLWPGLGGDKEYAGSHESQWPSPDTVMRVGGRATTTRPHWDADYYDLTLHGGSEEQFLALFTPDRIAAGRYSVVNSPLPTVHGAFTALLASMRPGDMYNSDSGEVVLRGADGGLDGSYVVYLTQILGEGGVIKPSDDGRHVVARGTFRLR